MPLSLLLRFTYAACFWPVVDRSLSDSAFLFKREKIPDFKVVGLLLFCADRREADPGKVPRFYPT